MNSTIVYRVYFRWLGDTEWRLADTPALTYQGAQDHAEQLKSDPQIAEVDIIDKDVS